MRCWRINLQRDFSLYLNGELTPQKTKRVEDHLLDCGWCRTRLARVRGGHRFAQAAPRFTPQRDPWAAIEAAIDKEQSLETRVEPAARPLMLRPSFVIVTAAVVILFFGLFFTANRRESAEKEREASYLSEALDLREFHAVSIADMERTTQPHVMAEGFVSQVLIGDEDGDLRFKLVENLQQEEPFIICEIIEPIKLAPPTVGSRVRVYGVSRYDSKENHNWYEVHPVLNIQVVRD